MKKLLLFSLVIGIASCQKAEVPTAGVVIAANLDILFKNANGQDLLDPAMVNAIRLDNTDKYVIENNQKVRYFQGNLDASKGFRIFHAPEANAYYMRLFFPESPITGISTQFLRYENGTEDKFVGEFSPNTPQNRSLVRIWLNDVLVWGVGQGLGIADEKDYPAIQITK